MYVILTSKPGQFRTEVGPNLCPVEAYDYLFYGRLRARFLIAELVGDTRVRIVDETEPISINEVPSKFLEKFKTIESARQELHSLCVYGDMDTILVAREAASFNCPAGSTA